MKFFIYIELLQRSLRDHKLPYPPKFLVKYSHGIIVLFQIKYCTKILH